VGVSLTWFVSILGRIRIPSGHGVNI